MSGELAPPVKIKETLGPRAAGEVPLTNLLALNIPIKNYDYDADWPLS